jgi:hypothetical protein
MDQLRRITAKLEIEGVTVHTFRHTVITLRQDSGLPMKATQTLAGHATERTTARVYSRTMPEHLARVADAMGKTFAGMDLPPSDLLLTNGDDPWNTSGGHTGGQETSHTA